MPQHRAIVVHQGGPCAMQEDRGNKQMVDSCTTASQETIPCKGQPRHERDSSRGGAPRGVRWQAGGGQQRRGLPKAAWLYLST